MNIEAYKQHLLKTQHKVAKVVDGDGLFVYDIFTKKEIEIRLLGIDAPELKNCKKLIQDERETHLPGHLLKELGRSSFNYLLSLAPKDTTISFATESMNNTDPYGRTLAYVFLPDGTCLNEEMIKSGYAKPFDKYFCSQLAYYKQLSIFAKGEQRGNYSRVQQF
jgi:micrococcal nuclease